MLALQLGGYSFDPALAIEYGRTAGAVVAILIVTWILAKLAKWTFAKLVDRIAFLRREAGSGESIGMALGRIVAMLVWLFGLIAVLNVLRLGSVTAPVETLLNTVMGYIPNLIGAGIIFFVGSMIAKIVRQLVETALQTLNFDAWANRGGVDKVTGNATISKTLGTLAYVLVIVPVAIAALQALRISSISDPLVSMLQTLLAAIPNIIGASILLGLGYLIGKWVAGLAAELLPALGVDRSVAALGLLPAGTSTSHVIGKVAMVAIMMISAVAATRLLGFPELTALVDQILQLGGAVVFGGVIIAVGFLVANLLAQLVGGSGGNSTAAAVVRYATITLFVAMGLKFMGIADSIIEMAFGALVIGGAAAGALAFGLGGRDAAARMLARIDDGKGPPAA
ncbi:mechanosensitive ion channel [Novosphingobium lentum]|uniref:mechanosensitive ion channel n=1 Tax=Novosphingobium lentum TaxID=145287 RepID=UPI0009FD9AED|nr:mechanosensitive ion channel [Novosphingobium lentum]